MDTFIESLTLISDNDEKEESLRGRVNISKIFILCLWNGVGKNFCFGRFCLDFGHGSRRA